MGIGLAVEFDRNPMRKRVATTSYLAYTEDDGCDIWPKANITVACGNATGTETGERCLAEGHNHGNTFRFGVSMAFGQTKRRHIGPVALPQATVIVGLRPKTLEKIETRKLKLTIEFRVNVRQADKFYSMEFR